MAEDQEIRVLTEVRLLWVEFVDVPLHPSWTYEVIERGG